MGEKFLYSIKIIFQKGIFTAFAMIISFFIGWFFGVLIAFTPLVESITQILNILFKTTVFVRENFAILMGTIFFFSSLFIKFED